MQIKHPSTAGIDDFFVAVAARVLAAIYKAIIAGITTPAALIALIVSAVMFTLAKMGLFRSAPEVAKTLTDEGVKRGYRIVTDDKSPELSQSINSSQNMNHRIRSIITDDSSLLSVFGPSLSVFMKNWLRDQPIQEINTTSHPPEPIHGSSKDKGVRDVYYYTKLL